MKKLVIIPAFNESGSILRAVQDIKEHAPGFDYVVINDCSTDDTLQAVSYTQLAPYSEGDCVRVNLVQHPPLLRQFHGFILPEEFF